MTTPRKRKAPPKPTSKAARKTLSKGATKVKSAQAPKVAKPTVLLQWRTAWIDQRGRRAKAPEGEPPPGWRQIAWQAYRDPKGRWVKPSQTQLDATEIQYQVRYRLTKGLPGKRREWRSEADITQDDPELWLRKMDIARFRRRGEKGRWELERILDTNQDVRNLVKLDKYRKLEWTEVPEEQKLLIRLQGKTLAEALSKFVFPAKYGETWSITGKASITIKEGGRLQTIDTDPFSVIEDWYKRFLRDGEGNILKDKNGRPRYDSSSGVYDQWLRDREGEIVRTPDGEPVRDPNAPTLQDSWRNRLRQEVSKVLRDKQVRFSNAQSIRELWESGALAKRKKAGYWKWVKAKRDREGRPVPGTAKRVWVVGGIERNREEGDRRYSDLMSRKQAVGCNLVLWIERVKIPEE